MTENNATATVTPAADPVDVVYGDRTIVAKWNVGEADEYGCQPRAHLEVYYWKSARSYRAELRTVRFKIEAYGVTEKHNLSLTAKNTVIHEQKATRFNRNTFSAAYHKALADLRSRFEDGDEAVTAYFDPTSDKHNA